MILFNYQSNTDKAERGLILVVVANEYESDDHYHVLVWLLGLCFFATAPIILSASLAVGNDLMTTR
jgi:hypothetical protein